MINLSCSSLQIVWEGRQHGGKQHGKESSMERKAAWKGKQHGKEDSIGKTIAWEGRQHRKKNSITENKKHKGKNEK
ncbi:hypothetical protein [Sphingobacterium sp. UBA5996]|uniref:hypothetical protein n=1 Tax=Sphingobacterium sp. UBA5996 TaxID=1947505 RepID=UPI0025E8327D|nr:hypothetical protein [Sphingobacterium sp. UBA5996]